MENKKYDIFISHASEDKDLLVRPLAMILERLSVRVWYDEFSLKLGDSLTTSIDMGLHQSRFGLLVLSKSFLGKNWPDYEYRSLLTRQIDGDKVILPLWYGVTKEDVKKYSLYLADIKAVSITKDNYKAVIALILRVVRPDIWQEMRMRGVLRKVVVEGTPGVTKLSAIKKETKKQSKLSPQQYIRSKAVYYGIGRHLKQTFDEHVEQYELDIVPERELQTWEIMNACYLEMLERHTNVTMKEKEDYFKVLVGLSVGLRSLQNIKLKQSEIEELVALWKENYYEF